MFAAEITADTGGDLLLKEGVEGVHVLADGSVFVKKGDIVSETVFHGQEFNLERLFFIFHRLIIMNHRCFRKPIFWRDKGCLEKKITV